MIRLKAYTAHGLITSNPMQDDEHIKRAILELSYVTTIKCIYITDGKKSKQLNFSIITPKTRPIYYTRSDGAVVYGLSIIPEYYPMTAHYSDGRTELIQL